MFIDANDDKWTLTKIENVSHVKPMSICFWDAYGNFFLNRVKECMGKPILIALAVPFECYVEKDGIEHEKRKGFLMANDFMGMLYAYGIVEKLKGDFIPLFTKKDIHSLRKRGVLCFFDYGAVYLEFGRNILLEKEDMGRGITHPFLQKYCKSAKRFYYDFRNRRPKILQREQERVMTTPYFQQLKTKYHHKCVELLEDIAKVGYTYTIERHEEHEEKSVKCIITMKREEVHRAFEQIKEQCHIKKSIDITRQKELWILEKVPVVTEDNMMYMEEWQCEWLGVPCVEIRKTP